VTQAKIKAFCQLMRMDKPIGTLLLLWPTLWALFLAADGMPDLPLLLVFSLGVIVMRAAGCVINDFADRHFDGHVKRTKERPIPAGKVSAKSALFLFTGLIFIAFLLVLSLNKLTIYLSFIAVFLAGIYPFMKRVTKLPQLVLGMAFSMAIPMAYAAQLDALPPVAWLLFITNLIWTVAYDTLYAMVDRDDDLQIGIKSSAILFGRFDKMAIGILQLLTLLLLLWVGLITKMTSVYFVSVLLAGILFVYQQYLCKDRERQACFKAFLNNNWVGFVLFLGIAGSVLY
jgi:4-hydroxybenzoate polyprenyltransferase